MIDHVAYIILANAAGATSPLTLAAVLSRGFPEYSPALALKHGHAHLLARYPRHVLLDTLSDTLAATGKLGTMLGLARLWNVAGPATIGRVCWFSTDDHAFLR
ncbi:hypothetical protein BC828DRAFT_404209 [Blastocladiella britannica]|nr:hypothetical protein BC828DRAFT_404209 [Blastocladiella britannica]